MAKIVPEAFNGDAKVLVSENYCFIPSKGLRLSIPMEDKTTSKDISLIIQFLFKDTEDKQPGIEFAGGSNEVTLHLKNFLNALGAGTSTPIHLAVGNTKLSLLFHGKSLAKNDDPAINMLNFSLTLFEGTL